MKKLLRDWWLNPDWWVQGAHFLLGTAFVALPFFYSNDIRASILGTAILIFYSAIKEVWLDPIAGLAWGIKLL